MTPTLQVNVNMKSSGLRTEWTIGELASHFGLATHVLRHWESVGLLHPARRVNGRRRYTEDHLTKVAIIVRGRQVGFGLEELGRLLGAADAEGRRAVLERHAAALEGRIAQLQASKTLFERALACRNRDFITCPEFQRMVHALEPLCPNAAAHVG
jgi:MerR family transcriptional regulator, copper efflux regulator